MTREKQRREEEKEQREKEEKRKEHINMYCILYIVNHNAFKEMVNQQKFLIIQKKY